MSLLFKHKTVINFDLDFDCFQMIDFNDVYMLQEDENALAISLQLVSLVMPASDSWKATLQVWSQVPQ